MGEVTLQHQEKMVEVRRNVIKSRDIRKAISYPLLGHNPVKDILWMGPLVDMIIRSLDPGRCNTLEQFDTFRSSRSAFSTVWKLSIKGVVEIYYLGKDHRSKAVLIKYSTQTI